MDVEKLFIKSSRKTVRSYEFSSGILHCAQSSDWSCVCEIITYQLHDKRRVVKTFVSSYLELRELSQVDIVFFLFFAFWDISPHKQGN